MSTVLITGGSRGIGAAAVRAFAGRGDTVWFFYEKNEDAARALSAQTGATAILCDVADEEAVQAAFRRIGAVDILICCAGISHSGLIQHTTPQQWDRLFDVNVKGIYHCVRHAMAGFLRTHSGCIITVSSMWGQVGGACEVAYSATKGAVIAMTKALAQELGSSGIRVNCVAPGLIETDMCSGLGRETLEQMAADTPLGRNGRPEDVAQAMVYLADAAFVTGQVLAVNGGYVIT